MTDVENQLALIDGIVYGDVFDCAVTLDEAWRYSLVLLPREELRERFAAPELSRIIAEREGFYFLVGRDQLVERRVARLGRSRILKQRARRVARWLQYAPFVRGILLTGSVAVDDAGEDADVDMLVIAAARRLALAFSLLAPVSRLLSRRVFCPNYYLSEEHLELSRRDHYVARELAQSEPLAGNAAELLAVNGWVSEWMPNAEPRPVASEPSLAGRWLQKLLELPFRGGFGDRCDRAMRWLALARLAAHHRGFGGGVPATIRERFQAGVELRFHGAPQVDRFVESYEARRRELADRLRDGVHPRAEASGLC